MLVSLTPNIEEIKCTTQFAKEVAMEYIPQHTWEFKQYKGVYRSVVPYNFHLRYNEFEEVFIDGYDLFEGITTYGVADSIEQILSFYKEQIDSNEKYVISVTPVYQEKGGNSDGTWRWHKWGEYIGDYKPQCEYLNDEDFGDDFIGYVLTFNIHKVL